MWTTVFTLRNKEMTQKAPQVFYDCVWGFGMFGKAIMLCFLFECFGSLQQEADVKHWLEVWEENYIKCCLFMY